MTGYLEKLTYKQYNLKFYTTDNSKKNFSESDTKLYTRNKFRLDIKI